MDCFESCDRVLCIRGCDVGLPVLEGAAIGLSLVMSESSSLSYISKSENSSSLPSIMGHQAPPPRQSTSRTSSKVKCCLLAMLLKS